MTETAEHTPEPTTRRRLWWGLTLSFRAVQLALIGMGALLLTAALSANAITAAAMGTVATAIFVNVLVVEFVGVRPCKGRVA